MAADNLSITKPIGPPITYMNKTQIPILPTIGMKKIGIAARKAFGTFQLLTKRVKYPTSNPAIIAPINPIGVCTAFIPNIGTSLEVSFPTKPPIKAGAIAARPAIELAINAAKIGIIKVKAAAPICSIAHNGLCG